MQRNLLLISSLAAGALLLTGCATLPGAAPAGERQVSTNQCLAIAGAAALACALAGDSNRVARAALCGAAAFTMCEIAASFTAERTQTVNHVRDEHIRRHGQLPERATVTDFRHAITPQRARQGERVELTSTVVVVPGRDNAPVNLRERVELLDERGNRWGEPAERELTASEAGGFSTRFGFEVSNRFAQGQYNVRRTLLLNGQPVRTADGRFQVVQAEDGRLFAMLQVAH